MKIKNTITILLFTLVASACSNETATSTSQETPKDVTSNQSVAKQEADEHSEVSIESCAACHGKEGISSNTDWPNLAGQQEEYLYQQLVAYKNGDRSNALMSATLFEGFSDKDLRSIANKYSTMTAIVKNVESENDSPGAHVRARCVSCHGMTGLSVTSLWPNIAGQQAGYLANQLMAYKSGDRIHPTMQVIASELTEQQMIDVAEYYSNHSP